MLSRATVLVSYTLEPHGIEMFVDRCFDYRSNVDLYVSKRQSSDSMLSLHFFYNYM
jgi:hypothetical protein